jgi:hypothetical protein
VKVGGLELNDASNFAALAREVLAGRAGEQRFDDPYPVEWFFRAEPTAGPLWDRLTRGVSACLSDTDPLVIRQALLLFRERPRASGAEAVEELAEKGRPALAGVRDPMHPDGDLEQALLETLAARTLAGSRRALELARQIALEPKKALPLAAALARSDTDWTVDHAQQIVRGTPAALIAILVQLERLGRDYAELGVKLAPLGAGDPAFADDVARFLTDEAARRRILAALS